MHGTALRGLVEFLEGKKLKVRKRSDGGGGGEVDDFGEEDREAAGSGKKMKKVEKNKGESRWHATSKRRKYA
ncbi:hypothetical protein Nepgr_003347 [Nepenthes gracilis]|uniref:Uncharacterized protein n=1 Tax=Nepenthes gracilis TaxID=150966 RepID=A0AAD3RZC1_NEPGR|nr:hypothetical protein Nepgr_003347 [Nepenthes gracilis]